MQPDKKLKERLIEALEQQNQHSKKQQLAKLVHQQIQQRHEQRYERWGMRAVIVATITGLFSLPLLLGLPQHQNQAIDKTRVSPQLAEDLEMLKVLGQEAHAQ